jgi:hypothetical protein
MTDEDQDHARVTSSPRSPGHGNQTAPASAAPITAKDPSPTPAEQALINQDEAIASGEENVV